MRIKDLATRTAKLITGNAYFGVDNGANEVRKIDYKELAKQIIEEYNLSTLAGSAQSVQGALNALNFNLTNKLLKQIGTNITDSELINLTDDGLYAGYIDATSTCPSKNQWVFITVKSINNRPDNVMQEIVGVQGGVSCVRFKNNGTWGNWIKHPTRAEIDALNNRMTMGGLATTLSVSSQNTVGDACFFIFDRSDGVRYKISFGTNGKILYQKYENSAWTTVWEK